MAIQWGATSGNFRLGIDLSGSTLIVYAQSVEYGHNWDGKLIRGGAWSGSTDFNFYSGFGATVSKEIYRQTVSASGTYTVSTSYWNGSASASRTVTLGTAPGAPSAFGITRVSDTSATLSFTKGSGAVSTQITASKNSDTWYELFNPTGVSQTVQGLTVDTFWRFQLYSKNAAGKSAVIGPYAFYTKPKTPTTPTLATGKKVNWTLPARYRHGVQLAYRDTSSGDGTTVELGAVTTWTDPQTQPPTRQYRLRSWAGPSVDEDRTYSDWSDWSETAMGVTYKAPQVTSLVVRRCDAAGNLTELGKYVKVTSSGVVGSVKDTAGTETNKRYRKIRLRRVGTTTWSETTITPNGDNAANWTNVSVVVGGNGILESYAYEVQYTVADTYTTTPVVAAVTVPASQVAFSVGPSGVGAGKAWERGALDVTGDIYINGFGLTVFDDTRNEMNPPSWYQSNFPRGEYSEWKGVTITGVPKPSGATFGILRTTVPWSYYNSGWPILQTYDASNGSETWRLWRASSSETTWGPWEGIGPNIQIIEGTAYATSGVKAVSRGAWAASGGVFGCTATWTPPYTLPSGYTFEVSPYGSNGYIAIYFYRTTGVIRCISGVNATTLDSVLWKLVKA